LEVSFGDDWCKKLDNVETIINLDAASLEDWDFLISVTLLLALIPRVLNTVEIQDTLDLQGWWRNPHSPEFGGWHLRWIGPLSW
jgi:hypothetical protein